MITTTTLSVTIIVYSPWLMLLLIAGVLPAFLGESHFAFLGYAKNFRQTPVRRQLDYLRQVGGSKEAAKELKLFGLSQFLTERFTKLSDGIYEENVALSRRKLIAGAFLSVIAFMGYYSAYVFVIWRTITGAYTIGLWYLLSGAILQASSNIQQIFSTVSGIADQALFLTDLLAFFDMQPTIQSKPNALPAPRPIVRGFEFRNVSFHYPGSSRMVLNGLNFHLHPGERVALIGENGEGKTTIVKLITRLYDPTEGQVLLDGVDLREYRLEDLYREIGVIFQDFMRYEMTARENIAVGRIEEIDDLKLLEDAAQKSLADDVVAKIGGYDQMLGRRFETGVDLSGGEWQKIALARAYLRDAQLLILDEPTAALDARSEFEVFKRFAELTTGKMALFISHRFSTVRMADRIVVLEKGQDRRRRKSRPTGTPGRTLRGNVRNAGRQLSLVHQDQPLEIVSTSHATRYPYRDVGRRRRSSAEPPKEPAPNLEALSSAAADLGRRLVWLPDTRSPRFFFERYRALTRAIRRYCGPFIVLRRRNRWAMTIAGSTTTFALCTPICGERKMASSSSESFLTSARRTGPPHRA